MRRLLLTLVALPLATCPGLRAQAWSLDPAVAPVIVNDTSLLLNASFVPTPAGQFLVFGDFTHINGVAAPGLARLGVDGQLDATFASDLAAGERITSIAPLADGRAVAMVGVGSAVIVGAVPGTPTTGSDGTPASVGGVGVGVAVPAPASAKLIRLRADGRKDPSFTPLDCDGVPHLTTAPDGRVIVWGLFRTFGNQQRTSLARLNADGSLDATFAPVLATGSLNVTALAVASDGSVVVSGAGVSPPAPFRFLLVRLLASGVVDTRFAPPNITSTFSLLAVQPDGSVLAGNSNYGIVVPVVTTTPTGSTPVVGAPDIPVPVGTTSPLVRYTPTGTLDKTYSPQIPGLKSITRIAPLSGGRLAVEANVGPATLFYGGPAVFTLGVNGQLLTDWRKVPGAREGQRLLAAFADGSAATAGRLLVAQGTLVVASSFYPVPYDATAPAVATIMPIFLGPTLVDPALAISPPDASAAPTTPLAALPTTIVHRYTGSVSRLETDSAGRVLATGSFTQIDGQPRAGIARFMATGGLDATFAPAAGELLFVPPDGRVIVRRTTIGPVDATDGFHRYVTQIVRLQNDGSVDPTFALPANLDATKTNWLLAAPDGRLLIAAFDPDDTKEENLKLIWLGADGRRLTTLPTVFTGFTRFVVMPLDATTGTAVAVPADVVPTLFPIGTGRPNVIDAVQLLADGRLLVAGAFAKVNGTARAALARLNADGSLDASYAPDTTALSFFYSALPLADGRALAFGSSITGGRWQPRVVRFQADGKLDATFRPPNDTIGSGARVLADGSFFSGGRRFTADGWPDLNFAPQLRSNGYTGYAYAAVLTPGTLNVRPSSLLWLGGGFDQANGQPRSGLARFVTTEVVGITVSPASQKVVAGRDAFFQVAIGTTQPATFRWTHDGATIAGATTANLRLPAVRPSDAGVYRAIVTIGAQTFTSEPATLTVVPSTARLTNFSARSMVSSTTPPQIAGVVLAGAPPRTVLLRAVGRGLPVSMGTALLASPVLTLYDGGQMVSQDRGGATTPTVNTLAQSVGAFPLSFSPATPPGTTLGSALTPTLGAGVFTAVTTSGDGSAGASLFEFYDTATDGAPALVRNLAIRGTTAPGAAVLTAGFVIAGNGPLRLLVRGVGPALAQFGLGGTIADPRLDVFAGSVAFASNAGWNNDADLADAARQAGAFAFSAGSRDTAVLLTLEPGAYTAQLASTSGGSGTAMIEIYVLDD